MLMLNRNMSAERELKSILGVEQADQIIAASDRFPTPIPVAGSPLYVVDGIVVPRIMGGGFSSLSDLISEATTGGKGQDIPYAHVGTLAVTGVAEWLWPTTGLPGPGAAPSAIAAGTVPTRATAGAYGQADPTGGDTLHITTISALASAVPGTLLFLDLLWHGGVAMNSAATQTISGTPTRYTGLASKGNFIFLPIRTTLPATAHNNTITYVDQDGNAAEAAAAVTGVSAGAATRMDHPNWFVPLNSGDTGVRNLTVYQSSAAVATGQIDVAIGHPYCFVPLAAVNQAAIYDGINSAFGLQKVETGAAITAIGIRGNATAMTYSGAVKLVSG